MMGYQRRDSSLTLARGLAEYQASRPGLVRGRGDSPAARVATPLGRLREECGIRLVTASSQRLALEARRTGGAR